MAHPQTHGRPVIDPETAERVAATMHALSTPSRVLILGRLRESPATVLELADHVHMERSAVSHQLRVLRELRLVTCQRDGRTMVYDLYDDHVVALIDQAVHHSEHVRLGLARRRG